MGGEIRGVVEGTIKILDCPPRMVERLDRATSFPHPDFVRAKRLGRVPFGIPERLRTLVEFPDGSVELPRGAIGAVLEAANRDGLVVKFENRRCYGTDILVPREPDLRDYQAHGRKLFLENLQGVICLPCGTGKTRLGVACVASLRRRTIIVAHTSDLIEQWVKDVREHLDIVAGVVDADRRETGADVVVASVFTLATLLDTGEGRAWVRAFGLVIVDEAHHAPAETFQRCLARIPARWRLGLTATPVREDGLEELIFLTIGPILYEKTTDEMIARKWLMLPELVEVRTELRFAWDGPDKLKMGALDKLIETDEARNALIADVAARDGKEGEWVFVLVGRRDHAFRLGRMIYERGCPCLALTGAGGKRAKESRRAALERMAAGEGEHVLIGTSLLDEGVNVPRLSRIVLAYPSRAEGAITQRVGRAIRDFPGKKPRVYDVLDPHVDTLARRADDRRRTFRKLGISR
jgi:superfamily II DNA or RNA helicase